MTYPSLPKPYRLDKGALPAAGVRSNNASEIFRSGILIHRAPMMEYRNPEHRWNYPGTKYYSIIPDLPIGLPFDNKKPRKGKYGETLGTKMAELTPFLEDEWEKMKVRRVVREKQALLDARAELEHRMNMATCGPDIANDKSLQGEGH